MIVLRLAVFLMAMVTFAGILTLIVLTVPSLGMANATGMIGSAAIGTLISLPVTYFVSNAMAKNMSEGFGPHFNAKAEPV